MGSPTPWISRNPGTGALTQITGGLLPANASPHGLAFLPASAAVPGALNLPFALLGLGLLALPLCARRRKAQ